MGILRNLFKKNEPKISSYEDFWIWFGKHQESFYNTVKAGYKISEDFLDKISPKLDELKEGYYYLTGMCDDNKAELIITADGIAKNIVFAEELVAAAPAIPGWKFTALKPSESLNKVEMNGFVFSEENLHFFSNDSGDFPDEIDLTIVYKDLNEENKDKIRAGVYIFLDNHLGELEFLTMIDQIQVAGTSEVSKELIPMGKLKEFLIWREKEFIEKYDDVRYSADQDAYTILEAKLNSGNPLIAVINRVVLEWDSKVSHPWILKVLIRYDGRSNRGMPDNETFKLMDRIEDEITLELKAGDGYLHIGRETADNERIIYFACIEFRKPSKVVHLISERFKGQLEISYDIFKDKYWKTFDHYRG